MAIRLAEIIDRIWITVPLSMPQLMQCHQYLWEQIKAKRCTPKRLKWGWRGTFDFGADVSVGITVAKVYGYRLLQYDLQPTELDPHTFEEFVQLASGFPGASYAEALVNGKVSYLEVAVDFLFKDTWDLLTHMPGAHTSLRFFPAEWDRANVLHWSAEEYVGIGELYEGQALRARRANVECLRARFERRLRHLGRHPSNSGSCQISLPDWSCFQSRRRSSYPDERRSGCRSFSLRG